ncbi:PAS domain S-box protein [Sediminibacterium roseum]|uniref:histidine kinase n=1 Tax=Sediminibacterium roseum TaxID=1978412 RepID=A0ABX0A1P0_9BACT|nr:PAS domain S-box protein [Sediminibacterium roseum]NCI51867.1 PAS domain S-box protein [Sediminibacterium roseum]
MIHPLVYESFFENSLNALFILKDDGTIVRANRSAVEMFGYTEGEFKQLGRPAFIDTTDPEFIEMIAQRSARGKGRAVITGIRKNGEKFPLEISSVVIKDETGEELTSVIAKDVSQQVGQEQKLKVLLDQSQKLHQKEEDSRMLLESVLDSITDGFFIVDRNWKILFWNKAAENIMRRKEAELIGKDVWEEFPDLKVLQEHIDFKTLFEKNQSVRFREYFPAYRIWADVSAYPSEKNISVYFKDVTEVKNLRTLEQLEREVLEMNARPDSDIGDTLNFYLRQLQEIHKGMICSVQRIRNNKIYNWAAPSLSDRFATMIDGCEVGEGAGSCGTSAFRREKVIVVDIENDPLWSQVKEAAAAEGVKACWSFPLIDSRNEVMGTFAIYYKRIKAPTKEEENTLERAKNLLMIILENRLSMEAVQSSNQNYDMVAKATNDAIWDWNVETDHVNRTGNGLEVLFGYKFEDAENEDNFWNARIHPEDLPRFLKKQADTIRDPSKLYWEDEYRFRKKDGTYAYVFDKGYIIRDKNGKAVRLIGATRDISERKESEALLLELNNRLKQRADELAASNVELERFAYIASHDMQEPLRMITSFLQLFKKKYEDHIDETAEQYIHFAVDGADRMKKLIMDLLEYSRVGSNKGDITEVDTNELLKEVENVFLTRIEEMKATIVIGDLPVIRANRTQMFQLFQNLIGNALKYHTGESPRVEVEGKEEANHFTFSVRDNGIGIKPIFFEKIFVLFQRLHHKNEYSGTGIGLAICKKIVDKHGGRIWVESEPGKGSCFYFTISKSVDDYRLP